MRGAQKADKLRLHLLFGLILAVAPGKASVHWANFIAVYTESIERQGHSVRAIDAGRVGSDRMTTAPLTYSQLIPPHVAGPPHIDESRADLVIGLLPERNVFSQKERYIRLQDYLSRRLELKIHFKIVASYAEIFNEVRRRIVDGAFFGSMGGAMAQLEHLVEMLARPVWRNGVSTYNGYIFTQKGNGILRDPATWKGRKIALVSRVTTAGFLFPLSVIRAAGIETSLESYFGRVIFAGSHDAAILAVLNGTMDFGACKNTVYDEYRRLHPTPMGILNILLESPHVPENGLGMRPEIPGELKQQIKKTLLEMDEDPEGQNVLKSFGATQFIETALKDYQPVIDMAKKVRIDLSQWSSKGLR